MSPFGRKADGILEYAEVRPLTQSGHSRALSMVGISSLAEQIDLADILRAGFAVAAVLLLYRIG